MSALQELLRPFGGDAAELVSFDETPGFNALRYASLFQAREHMPLLSRVVGVLDWQGAPFIYVVEAQGLLDDDIMLLRKALSLRGDAPNLALLTPGSLVVHRLGLDKRSPRKTRLLNVSATDDDAPLTLSKLSGMAPPSWQKESKKHNKALSTVLYDLLTKALDALRAVGTLQHEDALSLVGRALFLRFLADRRRLPNDWAKDPGGLFASHIAAQRASAWLDDTFNGDLLPIRAESWGALDARSLAPLRNILRGVPDGQLRLGWAEDWMHVHFGHIPVGVLGEVYERFIHHADPALAKASGVHYTPWRIAERMMAESFAALRREGRAADARVLDPAAGAGVFLQLCFRQLVAERTEQDGARPDATALRRILAEQVHGLDIHEGALRFAALGLYLSCIELEPTPASEDALRFPNLRETSLTLVDRTVGGSLAEDVARRIGGRYDLVIGNPPWTASSVDATEPVKAAQQGVLAGAKARLGRATSLPGLSPDLAFLWRAMTWARDGGQLALVQSGKLLHQQTEGMPQARADVWEALDVTGVVSGALLAGTKVWPGINADFCLLFATNRPARPQSATLLICPAPDEAMNKDGRLRLCPDQAVWVTPRQVAARPELFKVFLRGSALDLGVLEGIPTTHTLGTLWEELGLMSGNGFQYLRRSSKTREGQDAPGLSAEELRDLPTLTAHASRAADVSRVSLPRFEELVPKLRVHFRRARDLYSGPLVLVAASPKATARMEEGLDLTSVLVAASPKATARRLDVRVSERDLVFDQVFFGWSTAGHPEATTLARVVALQLRSSLSCWLMLARSGHFGVNWSLLELSIIRTLPVVPLDQLTANQRRQVDLLWTQLSDAPDADSTQEAIDRWCADIFSLSQDDLQVIRDTLDMGAPFKDSKERSRRLVHGLPAEFTDALLETLSPWAEAEGKTLVVDPIPNTNTLTQALPWRVLRLRCPELDAGGDEVVSDWAGLVSSADACGVSELVHPGERPGRLNVARLAYGRGWTWSRGVLLARRIVEQHLDALLGPST